MNKKFLVGGIIVVLLGGYALWAASRSSTATPATTNQNGQTSASSETTNPNAGGTAQDGGVGDSSSPADNNTAQYKDGTYTGKVGSAAPYGNVQVKATISGGKLTKVDVLTKPSGPGYTDQLSAQTFPLLVQEAIKVQGSGVHIVSGATQDSEGFQQSLASALAQASI